MLRAIKGVGLDFGELFDAHYDQIVSYLSRRVGRATAEDIASETFVQAFDRRAAFDRSRGTPRSWLFGIALQLTRRHRRSEFRRLRAYGRALSRYRDASNFVDDVSGRLDAQAAHPRLAAALARLDPGDYEVLTLRAWADFSYSEISAALSIPAGTVKSRLHRARREMKTQLASGATGDSDG